MYRTVGCIEKLVPLRQRISRAVPGLEVAGDGLALMLSNFIVPETNQTYETSAATHLHARRVGSHRPGLRRARAERLRTTQSGVRCAGSGRPH